MMPKVSRATVIVSCLGLFAVGVLVGILLSACGLPMSLTTDVGTCSAVCDRFFGPMSISVRERAGACYCEHYDPREPEHPDAWGWVRR